MHCLNKNKIAYMIKSYQGTQRMSFLTSLLCIGLSLLSLSAIRNQYRDMELLLKHQGSFITSYAWKCADYYRCECKFGPAAFAKEVKTENMT